MAKIKLVVAAVGVAFAMSAHADFLIDRGQTAPNALPPGVKLSDQEKKTAPVLKSQEAEPEIKPGVAQLGAAPAGMEPARGFAKDVSLLIALKQLVPSGWHAKRSGEIDMERLVSWKADGRTWVELLHTLGVSYDIAISVDWDKRELTVSPASSVKEYRPVKIRNVEPREADAKPEAPAVDASWKLDSARSLKENVEDWAKRAGWSVQWDVQDSPVAAGAEYKGKFEEKCGPVYRLVVDRQGSDSAFAAKFKKENKTLWIRPATKGMKPLPKCDG